MYDAVDVIGKGSFGIIRKVRRKSDGLVCPTDTTALFITDVYRTDFCSKGGILSWDDPTAVNADQQ